MNFEKFLRTAFLQNNSGHLFLYFTNSTITEKLYLSTLYRRRYDVAILTSFYRRLHDVFNPKSFFRHFHDVCFVCKTSRTYCNFLKMSFRRLRPLGNNQLIASESYVLTGILFLEISPLTTYECFPYANLTPKATILYSYILPIHL